MKKRLRSMVVVYLALTALIVLIFLTTLLTFPPQTTRSLVIATEPIATLLPHAHTPSDKVADLHHGVGAYSLPVEVTETMWVTEMEIDVTNAPRGVIHHLHLIVLGPNGERQHATGSILTVGQDTREIIRFPAPSGILLTKGTRLAIDAVLHNPIPPLGEGGVYKDVSISVRLGGVGDGEGRFLPIYFDLPRVTDSKIGTDDDSTFTVPAHSKQYQRSSSENPAGTFGSSHVFRADGWIVHMGAHMHAWEGAERTDAYLNGTLVKSYRSRRTDSEIPWSWVTNTGPVLIPVRKGDVLTVASTYSNPGDVPVVGAMGMMGVFFVEDTFSLALHPYPFVWQIERWILTIVDYIRAR